MSPDLSPTVQCMISTSTLRVAWGHWDGSVESEWLSRVRGRSGCVGRALTSQQVWTGRGIWKRRSSLLVCVPLASLIRLITPQCDTKSCGSPDCSAYHLSHMWVSGPLGYEVPEGGGMLHGRSLPQYYSCAMEWPGRGRPWMNMCWLNKYVLSKNVFTNSLA